MQHTHTVVPAQPGFNTIEVVYDPDGPLDYQLSPVIAWLIEVTVSTSDGASAYPIPIVFEGSDARAAVVSPSGVVTGVDGSTWSSPAVWLAAQRGDIA